MNPPIQIPFNLNSHVFVRLTPHGRNVLKQQNEILAATFGLKPENFPPKEEDAEGWSKWQMHELFQQLGNHVGMGRELAFETTIKFEIHTTTDL